MRELVIDGLALPLRSLLDLQIDFDEDRSVNRARMMDGSMVQHASWYGKLIIEISASGEIPPGLSDLDYTSSLTLKSAAERTISSSSNIITVPAARRSDYGVEGRAFVGSEWQSTPVSMSVDEATLTIVAGAARYEAIYWPEIVCFCDPPKVTQNVRARRYGWSLKAWEL